MNKILMGLPLLCAASVVLAQGGASEGTATMETTQTREQAQAQVTVRKPRPQEGPDLRRCLELKTNAAIIRCAETGRRR
jgi:hypothetical protein